MNQKPTYYVASFSGGKDSTAMVLRMIELGYKIDEVVFCDTTMEYPAMIRHVEKVKQVVEGAGIKFTTLAPDHDFEYYLTEAEVPNRRKDSEYLGVPGYGWPSHKIRWCTKHLKLEPIKKYFQDLRGAYDVIQYIGIAADEGYRLEREHNKNPNHLHPLVEWNWTEADAMAYCRAHGYDWEGLYDIFARVSCWCCPLQHYDELRKLRKHFPDLWQRLIELDAKQWQTYVHGYRVPEFELRFALEDALIAEGHSIKNRLFFADLKRLLAGETTVETILNERKEKTA